MDTIHGIELEDPYRWLEDQTSPETRAWIDAQNAYAERVPGETALRKRLHARFGALLRFDEVGSPRKGGSYEHFTLNGSVLRGRSPSSRTGRDSSSDERDPVRLRPHAFLVKDGVASFRRIRFCQRGS